MKSLIVISVLCFFFSACQQHDEKVISAPHPDEHFTQLFNLNRGGFTGGDATYSVPLPDGRTVWIFGDTFLGTVQDDSTREKTDPMFIRNSFVVQEGEKMTTVMQQIDGKNSSTIIPVDVLNSNGQITQDSIWYWPGDGFIEDGLLKVFVSKFTQYDTGSWSFKWIGGGVASFSLPGLEQVDITEFTAEDFNNIHFGHAVFEDEDFTYIYGLKESKPYLARVKAGLVTADWEFYTGPGSWDHDVSAAVPIIDIDGSEQFSVIKHEDQFALVSQLGGFSTEVWAYRGENPWGPWGEGVLLFKTPIPFDNPNLYTYNAVVHPQFTENDELLISYNTNSFRLQDHFDNAYIYRPRFFRVPVTKIFER